MLLFTPDATRQLVADRHARLAAGARTRRPSRARGPARWRRRLQRWEVRGLRAERT